MVVVVIMCCNDTIEITSVVVVVVLIMKCYDTVARKNWCDVHKAVPFPVN